jgi:ABC-type glutathione transport system ATPase component
MLTDSLQTGGKTVLLRAVNLSKRYARGGWLSSRRSRVQVEVLRAVDLKIQAGTTLALIGVSGSGKSTLARCLACLEEPDSGEIWFAGKNLAKLTRRELVPLRRQIQLIFQEPGAALNPRFTAVEIVSEPLVIAGLGTKRERRERALELMELVGLSAHLASRLPAELSGGQRRRLAIARALTLEPSLLILDEALTGLDLSTRAQISNLLLKLQEVCSLTYLCISHDFRLVTHLADEVAVLVEGRIVEGGTTELGANSGCTPLHDSLPMALELSGLPGGSK